jgi:hypothetical protein
VNDGAFSPIKGILKFLSSFFSCAHNWVTVKTTNKNKNNFLIAILILIYNLKNNGTTEVVQQK